MFSVLRYNDANKMKSQALKNMFFTIWLMKTTLSMSFNSFSSKECNKSCGLKETLSAFKALWEKSERAQLHLLDSESGDPQAT